MSTDITIPRLGWSMEEGIFSCWLKKDGEEIKPGDPLFTLESDKAAHDVEATDGGLLHIPHDAPPPGAVVKVGQRIGQLLGQNEKPVGAVKLPASTVPLKEPNTPMARTEDSAVVEIHLPPVENEANHKTTSTPRARRQAAKRGVELSQVKGTGRAGRIREADVLQVKVAPVPTVAVKGSPPETATTDQMSSMRRSIAERTALSFSTIPHFYLRAELDATALIEMREYLLDVVERECGVRITLTDFLLRAQALALRAFPAVNAVWQGTSIKRYPEVDVGVVVGLPEGLVIPVIHGAQDLSLVQLARERARLVEAVRAGRFDARMLAGGTSSLSNLGTTRTDEFAAVIAPHQSTMLAVGRAAPRPYVVGNELAVRTTIRLCLSVDHRVLDGGPAAEFLGRIVELLERPKSLVEAEPPAPAR